MGRTYTEEKAKEKTCCNKTGRCIASGCMAWRWIDDEDRFSNCGESTKGYCGLAGKP